MQQPSTHHATFVIERAYAASPARVFRAWSDPAAKARWFGCHNELQPGEHKLDFRVDGRESLRTGPPGGQVHAFNGVYHDIVPNERIIYSYSMRLDDQPISVSLTTIEFHPEDDGTRLTFTEQCAYLDGYDGLAEREEGTREGLDRLEAELRRA